LQWGLLPVLGRTRRVLSRVPGLSAPLHCLADLKECVLDSSARDLHRVETLFASRPDPYRFALEPQRFARASGMLEAAGSRFPRALEIGCAEGLFTEELARRCDSLLAVDLSPTALARAAHRCRDFGNVRFAQWDLRSDPLPGTFDLIVATGVLEYILRPSTLRRACDRIVQALQPGGYLLLGNTVAESELQDRWWSRPLLRGTWINRHMALDPRLQLLDDFLDKCLSPFQHTLFRRVAT
jgi:SAM-dependent methyltransferase